ncbi:hypothetical protein SAMN05444166_5142 [Singulisphaera sp. GP187]|uniref:hypothetical protein n=1 Tax=Singulisphaera sp. GP187 TaxID=1882752 RepID=UPI0009286411|nr:hypothetical protein [Singulisphaera sp. GP187]SIO55794.1 hypothetical protein SAMN05444166_5142 [Singulisphaera sp. GP187]
MTDSLSLSRSIQGELPFSLNLPESNYVVDLDGTKYQVELLQNRVAIPVDSHAMMMGKPDELKLQLSERWDSLYKIELRTIVRRVDTREVQIADMAELNDDHLVQAAITKILLHDPGKAGDPKQLENFAKAQLAQLDSDGYATFRNDTAIRLTADKLFPATEVQDFCKAVNVLIRSYIIRSAHLACNFSEFSPPAISGIR